MSTLPERGKVVSQDGIEGRFERRSESDPPRVLVEFVNGQRLWVPAGDLSAREDGYLLPLRVGALSSGTQEPLTIPVVAESVQVDKRQVETGVVRVTKRVREHQEVVDEPLLQEGVEVERKEINRFVKKPESMHYEDDVLVLPVYEEVLVVEKRLLLKEEVRISRRRSVEHRPQTVTRRAEEVAVERFQHPDENHGGSSQT